MGHSPKQDIIDRISGVLYTKDTSHHLKVHVMGIVARIDACVLVVYNMLCVNTLAFDQMHIIHGHVGDVKVDHSGAEDTKLSLITFINKAIRDGKYLAPPHASAWQRSPN